MKNWMSLTIGTMIALAPVSVMAETYLCEMGAVSGHDSFLIPPQTYIEHDTKTGEIMVYDGLIDEVYSQPIAAEISYENDKRITYAWSVKQLKVQTTEGNWDVMPNNRYNLTIMKANLSARESMKPLGYQNTFKGKGKCVLK